MINITFDRVVQMLNDYKYQEKLLFFHDVIIKENWIIVFDFIIFNKTNEGTFSQLWLIREDKVNKNENNHTFSFLTNTAAIFLLD